MTTELKKFTDAYASMIVAVYEPLILRWYSGWTLYVAADTMAWRLQKAKYIKLDKAFATAQALNIGRIRPGLPHDLKNITAGPAPQKASAADMAGNILDKEDIRAIHIKGYPDAVAVGDKVYPRGVLNVQPKMQKPDQSAGLFNRMFGFAAKAVRSKGDPNLGAKTLPTFVSGRVGVVDPDFDFVAARKLIFSRMIDAVKACVTDPKKNLEQVVFSALKNINGVDIYEFLPTMGLVELLSPIGVAHYYRQLYFNTEEGFGPVEEVFSIAPLETLEVVYEKVRRQIHEELMEVGTETVSETAVETKNLDEVSDKVSSMIQRDASAAMSVQGSYSTPVWQVGASASANMSTSSQRGREEASHKLKETTKRASERITKSFSIKTRDIEDVTTMNLTRRVIKNDSDHPVSYGLRRVLRRVRVKVQDLGPHLVWQLYVRNPGAGLARSRFAHFREAEPIAVPDVPPGMRPRPTGGTDTGSTSSALAWDSSRDTYYVTVAIQTGADRRVTAVSIDSISDLEGGGKNDYAPSPRNDVQWNQNWDEGTHTYTVNVAILEGDAASVSVTYTYSWEPSQEVLDEWENERKAAVATLTAQALNEQFEREKTLITERSKIRPRAANELRREERYEVMNRMISHLFARGDDPSDPSPLEIEYFHRYFDIEGMFVYMHPSWWKPRYAPVATGFERPAYEITAESEPAPMGVSLGWLIQLDGDTRRNEFINSPWVRVCLPIRRKREREAISWLSKHIEGEIGYDPTVAPLKDIFATIDQIRSDQDALGINGPDYVTVNSSVGAPSGPLKPENVYPLIDEFEVTVPTDGFVYDELKLE